MYILIGLILYILIPYISLIDISILLCIIFGLLSISVNRFSLDIANDLLHPFVNLPLESGLLNIFILFLAKLNSYRSYLTSDWINMYMMGIAIKDVERFTKELSLILDLYRNCKIKVLLSYNYDYDCKDLLDITNSDLFYQRASTFIFNSDGIIDLIKFINDSLERVKMSPCQVNFVLSCCPKDSNTFEGSN